MERVHIRALPTLKGQTEFVTLNFTLGNQATSQESWEESSLRSNPEVMTFFSKGKISFVTEKDYARERKKVEEDAAAAERLNAALDPDTVMDVSDALETDNPSVTEALKMARTAQLALEKLVDILATGGAKRVAPKPAPAPASAKPSTDPDIKGDGLDLPMNPPPGMPAPAAAQQYLKKSPADKRKFLKECRDIGMLREAALFEPDAKLKQAARKAAKNAEKSAEEAQGLASASI